MDWYKLLYVLGGLMIMAGMALLLVARHRLKNSQLSDADENGYHRWEDWGMIGSIIGLVVILIAEYIRRKKSATVSPLEIETE